MLPCEDSHSSAAWGTQKSDYVVQITGKAKEEISQFCWRVSRVALLSYASGVACICSYNVIEPARSSLAMRTLQVALAITSALGVFWLLWSKVRPTNMFKEDIQFAVFLCVLPMVQLQLYFRLLTDPQGGSYCIVYTLLALLHLVAGAFSFLDSSRLSVICGPCIGCVVGAAHVLGSSVLAPDAHFATIPEAYVPLVVLTVASVLLLLYGSICRKFAAALEKADAVIRQTAVQREQEQLNATIGALEKELRENRQKDQQALVFDGLGAEASGDDVVAQLGRLYSFLEESAGLTPDQLSHVFDHMRSIKAAVVAELHFAHHLQMGVKSGSLGRRRSRALSDQTGDPVRRKLRQLPPSKGVPLNAEGMLDAPVPELILDYRNETRVRVWRSVSNHSVDSSEGTVSMTLGAKPPSADPSLDACPLPAEDPVPLHVPFMNPAASMATFDDLSKLIRRMDGLGLPDDGQGDSGELLPGAPVVDDAPMTSLGEWDFDAYALDRATSGQSLVTVGVHFGQDLLSGVGLAHHAGSLRQFVREIQHRYQPAPYHNHVHAADVTNSMMYFLRHDQQSSRCPLTMVGQLACLVAAVIHDVGHFGRSNRFHVMQGHSVSILYNDMSPLESMHCAIGFFVLRQPQNAFLHQMSMKDSGERPSKNTGEESGKNLPYLSDAEFTVFRRIVVEAVLATDMSKHFDIVSNFKSLIAGDLHGNQVPAKATSHHDAEVERMAKVAAVFLKSADVGHSAKRESITIDTTLRLYKEFFSQGDEERAMGLPISPLCDRHTCDIAKSQASFLDCLVLPLYQVVECYCMIEEDQWECNRQIRANIVWWSGPGAATSLAACSTTNAQ